MWYHGYMVHVVSSLLATVCCLLPGDSPPTTAGNADPSRNDTSVVRAAAVAPDAQGGPTLSIKTNAPSAVAYIEHRGAYWTLSKALSAVRDYTRAHGETGAIFIRYLTDPNRTPPASLRVEVGFAIEDDHEIEPPFRVALRSTETVATMVIEDRPVRIRRDYARAMAWIVQQGHEPLGPITEIHHVPTRRVRGGEARTETPVRSGMQRVEVQFLLATTPSSIAYTVVEQAVASTDTTKLDVVADLGVLLASPATEAGPTDELVAEESDAESLVDAADSPTWSDSSEYGYSVAEDQAVDDPVTLLWSSGAQIEIESVATTNLAEPEQVVTTEQSRMPSPEASVVVAREVNESESVAALYRDGRFDELAEAIMPPDQTIPKSRQVWFGQVVLRIGACARGLATVFPESGSGMRLTGAAILRRYKIVSEKFVVDPRSVSVAAESLHAFEGRSLLHDLDTLLGRIGTRTIGEEEATKALLDIMTRVRRVRMMRMSPDKN